MYQLYVWLWFIVCPQVFLLYDILVAKKRTEFFICCVLSWPCFIAWFNALVMCFININITGRFSWLLRTIPTSLFHDEITSRLSFSLFFTRRQSTKFESKLDEASKKKKSKNINLTSWMTKTGQSLCRYWGNGFSNKTGLNHQQVES